MQTFFPGTRVTVFDPRLYKGDVETPLSHTMRLATVKKWYGYRSERYGTYSSLIDVEFDYRPGKISEGHFTDSMMKILTKEVKGSKVNG